METQTALTAARKNKHRSMVKYVSNKESYANLVHSPKFSLSEDTAFFTIGSCFARNIENYLNKKKISYFSQVPYVKGEYFKVPGPDRTGYQNVYTPGSVLEMSQLVSHPDPFHSIVEVKGLYYDLLTHGLKGISKEDTISIRKGLIETYSKLSKVDVIIITLGYNEAWRFKPANSWVNQSPGEPNLRPLAEDFDFHILNVNDVTNMLVQATENFRAINKEIKIIYTVSPVPLSATFSEKHIVVANQFSKSTLRCAAENLASQFDFVDYFPSYEIIVNTEYKKAFKEDGIHVQAEAVENVMNIFFDSYFSEK